MLPEIFEDGTLAGARPRVAGLIFGLPDTPVGPRIRTHFSGAGGLLVTLSGEGAGARPGTSLAQSSDIAHVTYEGLVVTKFLRQLLQCRLGSTEAGVLLIEDPVPDTAADAGLENVVIVHLAGGLALAEKLLEIVPAGKVREQQLDAEMAVVGGLQPGTGRRQTGLGQGQTTWTAL